MGRLAKALRARGQDVRPAGTSDLVIADCGLRIADLQAGASSLAATLHEFSGNSMRAKRSHFLYHGTLLYDFDLALVETCLQMPPRQPVYRQQHDHHQFVTNLALDREALVGAVLGAWPTADELADWPRERVRRLVAERFGRDDWNLRFGRE